MAHEPRSPRRPAAPATSPQRSLRPLRDSHLVLAYLLLAAVFFLPALSPAVMIFGTDWLAGGYVSHEFAAERFAAGEIPRWNPYLYGGLPYFANPGSAFHPLTVALRWVIPTHGLFAWLFFAHVFLAGVGTFYLVREMGGRRPAAFLAGVSYMFTAFLLSSLHAGHDGRLIVAALTPAFLFTIHRSVRTGRLGWFLLGGGVLGSALLTFQIQSSYYMLLAGAVMAGYSLVRFRATFAGGRGWGVRLAGGGLILGLGFGLAAVNFLPFLDYVDHSPRGMEGGRGYEYAVSWSMPPGELLGLALPDRVGMDVGEGRYWGENPFKLHTEYVGAWVLVMLVLAGVFLRSDRRVWLWAGVGLLAVLISLGGHTPVYRVFYELLPGTRRFRAPSISFFLVVLSLAVIAGLAFSHLLELRQRLTERARDALSDRRRVELALAGTVGAFLVVALWVTAGQPAGPGDLPARVAEDPRRAQAYLANYEHYLAGAWRLVLFAGAVAGVVWLFLRERLGILAAVAVLATVSVVDLWAVGKRFLETVDPPAVTFAPDPVVQTLRASPEEAFRVWYLPGTPQTNHPNLYGIELVAGEHGNQLQRYNEFLGAGEEVYVDYHNIGRYPAFLAVANVRYLVAPQALELPFLTRVHEGPPHVYRNEIALPRAYLVDRYRVADPPHGALEILRSEGFDPWAEVVLYREPPIPAGPGEPGEARIVTHRPDEVVVRVEATSPALLVLADNHYPGWRARVDGEEVPILLANHTFRAVPVPAGASTVRFSFEPRALAHGLRIYLGLLLLLLAAGAAYGILAWRRRRVDA